MLKRGGINDGKKVASAIERGTRNSSLTYDQQVLAALSTSLISYLPLTETTGTALADASGNGRGATAGAGVTVGGATFLDGSPAALIGSSYINWYSASFSAAFNPDELTLMGWAKHLDGSWGTAADRTVVSLYSGANAHYVRINQHASVKNLLQAGHHTSADAFPSLYGTVTPGWFHVAVTVSKSNDRARSYVNGELVNSVTGVGTWTGVLSASTTCIGSVNLGPLNPWGGPVRGWGAWAREVAPAEILAAYRTVRSSIKTLMCVGDSKTAGDSWRYSLRQKLLDRTGVTWHNGSDQFAVAGATTASLKTNIDTNLASVTITPDTILYNLGANDVTSLPAEATWKANTTYNIDAFRAKWPGKDIYIVKPGRKDYDTECTTLASWIDDIVALYASGVYVGIDEQIVIKAADNYAAYTLDGIHYSDAGQLAAASAWDTLLAA